MHKFCRNEADILVILGSYKYTGHTARTQGFIDSITKFSKQKLHVRECHNNYEETYQCVTEFLKELRLARDLWQTKVSSLVLKQSKH